MARYKIEVSSNQTFEDARRQLETLNVSQDEVESIAIELEVDRDVRARIDQNQHTFDDIKSEDSVSRLTDAADTESSSASVTASQGQVEYGPRIGDAPNGPSRAGAKFSRDVDKYQGSRYTDAVMPDTFRASVMRSIDGSWKTSPEIADELDHQLNSTSAALSKLFHDYGYAKRRDEWPAEYTLTQDGKTALKEGMRRAEENYETTQ